MTIPPGRPASLLAAAGLLLIIGVSGMFAGFELIPVMVNARDVPLIGLGIGAVILGYGVLTAVAGIGVLVRRRWAWWLAIATIGAGLLFLIGMVVVLRQLDPLSGFGIAVWGVTLACLVAPATRDAAA